MNKFNRRILLSQNQNTKEEFKPFPVNSFRFGNSRVRIVLSTILILLLNFSFPIYSKAGEGDDPGTDEAVILVTDIIVSDPNLVLIPFKKSVSGELPRLFEPDQPVGFLIGPEQAITRVFLTTCPKNLDTIINESVEYVCVFIEDPGVPGQFTGPIDVTDNENGDDIVTLKVTFPGEMKALVNEITIQRTRKIPPWWTNTPYTLFVNVPYENLDAMSKNLVELNSAVGHLSGPKGLIDQPANVSVTRIVCEKSVANSICLALSGISTPGEYSGTVDLTADNDSGDELSISISVRDHVLWAVLASLVGLLMTLWAQRIRESTTHWYGLMAQAGNLKEEIRIKNGDVLVPKEEHVKIYVRGIGWSQGKVNLKLTSKGDDVGEADLSITNARKPWEHVFCISKNEKTYGKKIYTVTATHNNEGIKKVQVEIHWSKWIDERVLEWLKEQKNNKGFETSVVRLMIFIINRIIVPLLKFVFSPIWLVVFFGRWLWFIIKGPSSKPKSIDLKTGASLQVTTNRKLGYYRLNADQSFNSFEKEVQRYHNRQLVWDTASDEYKGLIGILDKIKADIDRLASLETSLEELEKQHKDYQDFLIKDPFQFGKSYKAAAILKSVNDQLLGVELYIGKLEMRIETINGLNQFMKDWKRMACIILRNQKWANDINDILIKTEGSGSEDTTDNHPYQKRIDYIQGKLIEACYELYDAADSDALEKLLTKKELDRVYHSLAQLGGFYKTWWEQPKLCQETKTTVSNAVIISENGEVVSESDARELIPSEEITILLESTTGKPVTPSIENFFWKLLTPIWNLVHREQITDIFSSLFIERNFEQTKSLLANLDISLNNEEASFMELSSFYHIYGDFLPEIDEAPPVLLKESRSVFDLASLLLALATALVIGLTGKYYPDATFGSIDDYLAMIFIGGGSQIATTGLVKIISRLMQGR